MNLLQLGSGCPISRVLERITAVQALHSAVLCEASRTQQDAGIHIYGGGVRFEEDWAGLQPNLLSPMALLLYSSVPAALCLVASPRAEGSEGALVLLPKQ